MAQTNAERLKQYLLACTCDWVDDDLLLNIANRRTVQQALVSGWIELLPVGAMVDVPWETADGRTLEVTEDWVVYAVCFSRLR